MKQLLFISFIAFASCTNKQEPLQQQQGKIFSHLDSVWNERDILKDTIIETIDDTTTCRLYLDSLLAEDTCIGLKSIGINIDRGDAKLSPKAYAAYDTMPTVAWVGPVRIFNDDTYEDYKKLSERGKHIVDSLQEAGLQQLSPRQLSYRLRYMQAGKNAEKFWGIRRKDVIVYVYYFWKNDNGSGYKLFNEKNYKVR